MNSLGPVEDVERARPDERLELALYYLKELTGDTDAHLSHYWFKFRLHKTDARLTHFLASNGGHVCTYEKLWALMPDTDIKNIKARMHTLKTRLKFHADVISVPGVGCMVSEEDAAKLLAEDAPVVLKGLNSEPIKRGRPWTRGDDEDLLRENGNGSSLSFMAAEFERSERAIMDRLKRLGAHYHGTAHMCQADRTSGARHSPVAA